MKVDIIKDCDFSPNGIDQAHPKAGDKNVEMRDDVAIPFIGYGFCKKNNDKEKAEAEKAKKAEAKSKQAEADKIKKEEKKAKALKNAPENKMAKGATENKKKENQKSE